MAGRPAIERCGSPSAIFSAIVPACGDLVADVDGVPLGPNVMIDRLDEALAQVSEFAADLSAPVNPLQVSDL